MLEYLHNARLRRSSRPQRRSALVAQKLARSRGVRFAEQGSLTEHGAGYTLYWQQGQAHHHGRLERKSGTRPHCMARSSETPWSRQLQRQRAHAVRTVCRTGTDNHQLPVPADSQIQDDLATPTLLKHWHLLNYVFVRQKDLCDVLQTRIMTSADSNADHRPIARKRGVQVLETNRLVARKI